MADKYSGGEGKVKGTSAPQNYKNSETHSKPSKKEGRATKETHGHTNHAEHDRFCSKMMP